MAGVLVTSLQNHQKSPVATIAGGVDGGSTQKPAEDPTAGTNKNEQETSQDTPEHSQDTTAVLPDTAEHPQCTEDTTMDTAVDTTVESPDTIENSQDASEEIDTSGNSPDPPALDSEGNLQTVDSETCQTEEGEAPSSEVTAPNQDTTQDTNQDTSQDTNQGTNRNEGI